LDDGRLQKTESIALVLECCDENLQKYIRRKPLSIDDVIWLAYQLLLAMAEVHGKGILHRDIKPENILLVHDEDKTILKLADFGLARPCGIPCVDLDSHVVSSFWRPPELFGQSTDYDWAIDMWSVGVTIVQMLIGKPPWDGRSSDEAWGKIRETRGLGPRTTADQINETRPSLTDVIASARRNCPRHLFDLVEQLVVWEPDRRLSAVEALHHATFAETRERYARIFPGPPTDTTCSRPFGKSGL
jgi:serine/threonine protein kinase